MVLQGKKLQGKFVLANMGRVRRRPREKSRWLLIKRKDEYAKRSWDPEDDTAGRSVLTGRTLGEVVVRKVAQPVTTKGRSKRSAA